MKLLTKGMMTKAVMLNMFYIKASGEAWKSLCLSWDMWSPWSDVCVGPRSGVEVLVFSSTAIQKQPQAASWKLP